MGTGKPSGRRPQQSMPSERLRNHHCPDPQIEPGVVIRRVPNLDDPIFVGLG